MINPQNITRAFLQLIVALDIFDQIQGHFNTFAQNLTTLIFGPFISKIIFR